MASRSLSPEELHLIGLTCMFLASKYEEVIPMRLGVLCEKAGYGAFTVQDIKNKEIEVLESLNFDVLGPNVYTFVQMTANKLQMKEQLQNNHLIVFNDLLSYISKMISYEYSIIKNTKSSLLAGAVTLVCFKLFEQIDKSFNIASNVVFILFFIQPFNIFNKLDPKSQKFT